MHRPSLWDTTHRSFILAANYAEGRGGSVPLDHVAPRCFTCGKLRPKFASQFLGQGRGPGAAWRAVVLPSDPDRGQLRWLTEQGAFMVIPVCAKCVGLGTLPIDWATWDMEIQRRREEFAGQDQSDVEVEGTRKGFRGSAS